MPAAGPVEEEGRVSAAEGIAFMEGIGMKRIILAGLLGGLVVFFWSALAHMVLPIGMMGMKIPADAAQQTALSGLSGQFNEEGIYLLPVPQPEIWDDDAAMQAFSARAAQQPYAFVAYQPQGVDGMAAFGMNLMRQGIISIAAALLAAWIVSLTLAGFMQRVLVVTGMGLFAWLVVNVPYWNWYRFPMEFTLGAFLEVVIGWLLAGLVIAALVNRRSGQVRGSL